MALSVPCWGCNGRREASYSTLTDAISAGETARGWIPDWLPRSSRVIKVSYDPSSPTTWCSFHFSPDDSATFRQNLISTTTIPAFVRHIPNPSVVWWPGFLTGRVDSREVQKHGFQLYAVTEPDVGAATRTVLFAVNWTTGYALFYRSAGS